MTKIKLFFRFNRFQEEVSESLQTRKKLLKVFNLCYISLTKTA